MGKEVFTSILSKVKNITENVMDNFEGEVIGEEVHECALGHDILSADLNREDALLTNIREHRVRSVADDLGGFVGGEGIWKIPKPPLHVSPECASALVRNGDKAFSNVRGISYKPLDKRRKTG